MRLNSKSIVRMRGRKKLRIDKIRRKLVEKELESIIVKSLPNIYYLSGLTSADATLFITMDKIYLLTDFRYLEQAAREAENYEILRVDNNLVEILEELSKGLRTIGIEEDTISWKDYRRMQKAFSGRNLLDASDILKEIRQVKEQAEIEIIRQAIKITDLAFDQILGRIAPGVTEEEIGLELEFSLRKMGASGKSFDFIVASGERSAMPHGEASAKKIKFGEQLTLDFGAKYKWYCSDLTRTVFVGEPEAKHRKIYDIVLEAQQAALEVIKPGLSGKEVDALAREVISKAGYGEYFGHGLGHSLGLEIHETPLFNPKETKILEPGMIMTVEPGIYIPDWGGVRIEDVVIVTNYGVEVLTQSPKQFIIID